MGQKFRARDLWGIIYPALMYIGITYVVQIIMMIAVFAALGVQYSGQDMSETELNNMVNEALQGNLLVMTGVAGFAAAPFGFMFMYFDVLKEKEMGIYKKYTGVKISSYLLIVPLAITSMLMGNELVSVIQTFLPKSWLAVYDNTAEILYGAGIGIQILTTVIAAPIIEEVIFRGLIFKRIRRVSNATIAIILSALFFGIFHWNVVQGIYAFIIGAILAYVYEKYKCIVAPIILHMTANAISVLVTNAVSQEELQQTQDIVYTTNDLIMLSIMAVIMGGITFLLLYGINRSVNAVSIDESHE